MAGLLLDELRRKMVETHLASRGIRDQRVLEAMATVPRELFVRPGLEELAYEDTPLPIGEGQTSSQPHVVALGSRHSPSHPTIACSRRRDLSYDQLRRSRPPRALGEARLERAIGVIYRPHTELDSHYFQAILPRQLDEYVWFDATTALIARCACADPGELSARALIEGEQAADHLRLRRHAKAQEHGSIGELDAQSPISLDAPEREDALRIFQVIAFGAELDRQLRFRQLNRRQRSETGDRTVALEAG